MELILRKEIRKMFEEVNPAKMSIASDIICDDWIKENPTHTHKLFKLCRMKLALVFQKSASIVDANWFDNGSKCGLDIINHVKKIAIELKNSTKTDNNSSKTGNLKKLSEYKYVNPNYRVIYGYVNGSGRIKERIYDNQKIECLYGNELLDLIYGKHKNMVIRVIKTEFMRRMTMNSKP